MIYNRPVTCRECGWKGIVAHCEPIAPRYLPERVAAGDVMPAGECPECGNNAMLDPERSEPCIEIVIVPLPERATKFGVRSTAQSLANVMSMARDTSSYRVHDMDSHGFCVAVYRPSPYPPMVVDGYLRIVRA